MAFYERLLPYIWYTDKDANQTMSPSMSPSISPSISASINENHLVTNEEDINQIESNQNDESANGGVNVSIKQNDNSSRSLVEESFHESFDDRHHHYEALISITLANLIRYIIEKNTIRELLIK